VPKIPESGENPDCGRWGCLPIRSYQRGFDNVRAGFDMTNMLLASGKQRIIYFGSMSDVRDEQRYTGYCQAMEAQGLPVGASRRIKSLLFRLAPA
jgi:DNA-binding LacI/PurR family transcriptional regulator